jgi:hypothetical protein
MNRLNSLAYSLSSACDWAVCMPRDAEVMEGIVVDGCASLNMYQSPSRVGGDRLGLGISRRRRNQGVW